MVAFAIMAGAALLSAGATAYAGSTEADAATTAAQTQSQAAEQGQQVQQNEFNTVEAQLNPYIDYGYSGANALENLTGTNPGGNPLTSPLTSTIPQPPTYAPFTMTQAQLEATPGYQFTKQQGLEATENSFAAQGLGKSGAAEKGLDQYTTGLASTTYQTQLQNYMNQQQQQFNQQQTEYGNTLNYRQVTGNLLSGQTATGENAAAQSGVTGSTISGNIANLIGQAGQASAAGTIGAANATAGAATGIAGNLGNSALTYALLNGGTSSQMDASGIQAGIDSTQPFINASIQAGSDNLLATQPIFS